MGSQHDGVCRTPSVRESLGRVSPPALEEARWAGWAGGQGSLLCQLGMGTELSPLPLFGVPPLGGGLCDPVLSYHCQGQSSGTFQGVHPLLRARGDRAGLGWAGHDASSGGLQEGAGASLGAADLCRDGSRRKERMTREGRDNRT